MSNYSPSYFRHVNLGTDPETNIIDYDTNELVPASKVLDEYFELRNIKEESEFVVGSDINKVTLKRTTRDTKVGPVHRIIPSKYLDCPVPSLVVDGTALEINTTPEACRRYAVMSVAVAINLIGSILDTVNDNDHNYRMTIDPTINLSEDTLKSLPKQAAVFGCDADTDIYGKVTSSSKIDASKHPKRYAGGHIHMSFGYANNGGVFRVQGFRDDVFDNKENRLAWFAENLYTLTKLYDRTIGLATTAINTSDKEIERREVYGQAGRVRLQPYGGIEYRTPSSYILLDPTIYSYVLLWAQVANNIIFNDVLLKEIENLFSIEDVVITINMGDSSSAIEMVEATHNLIKNFSGLSAFNDHQLDEKLEFAKYVHSMGGSHKVFNPDETRNRWSAKGFIPTYGTLPEVNGFVRSLGK